MTQMLELVYPYIRDFKMCVCECVCGRMSVYVLRFPGGASSKKTPANAGDLRDAGSVPELGRFPGEGHSNSFQYSCLDNPRDMHAKLLQTCLTVCSRTDCSPPGSPVHGTLWVSWTWVTISLPILGKFSTVISSSIFSCPFFLSSSSGTPTI